MSKLTPIEYSYDAYNGSLLTIRFMGSGWAILKDGSTHSVLNKNGEWEIQLQPSSRTEDFFQRCRYETLDEAVAHIERVKGLKRIKTPCVK